MDRMEKIKSFTGYFFLISLALFANSAVALTKWTMPSKPGNVPQDFSKSIINLTNWLLGFVALIAVTAIIWGGINYISSAGDTQKADLSKKIIYYAIMGLVVAGIAYALTNVIVSVILK